MSTQSKIGALILGALVAGCGPKPPPRSAADDDTAETPPPAAAKPAPPKTTQEEKAEQPAPPMAKAAPVKKVAAGDRKDFDKAFAAWEEAHKAGPISRKQCESLADAFRDAAKHSDVAAQAHFNAGTILEECGQDDDANKEYLEALAANPKFGPAIANLGEMAYRRKDVAGARAKFEQAINVDPRGAAAAYNNLGVLLYQDAVNGNTDAYKDAISKLRRALAIDSDSMPAYALLALIYYTTSQGDRSKLQLAELVCKEANLSNDHFPPIYNTMGLIELKKKNVTGALKDFEKAVSLDPNYVEAHLNIGAIGLSSRQYDKAQASFEAVLKLQPNNVDAVIGLGVALRGQKNFDEAEKQYKHALELDPKNCAVPYNLGVLYQDYKNDPSNQNLRDAQKYYNQYLSCGKTSQKKVADAQRRIKDIDDTFVALEQARKMEEENKKLLEEQERMMKQQQEQEKQQQEQQKTDEKAAPAAAPQAKSAK